MVDQLVDAMIWWDKWQLRVLILGSLILQWFILLAAPMRKYAIYRCFRTFIWLAYISSDALAIYALATLFNRHARDTGSCGFSASGKASALEVLWAPILLIHLGGQRELTAYEIEDNELWTRHTVTLISQVTVAVYAYYKAWPSSSDRRLLASAVLLFITGFFSFCEKPWALYRARINRLAAVSSMLGDDDKNCRTWKLCFTELNKLLTRDSSVGKKHLLSPRVKVHMILSDLSLYAAAKDLDQELEPLDPAVGNVSLWLRNAFGLIYTRSNVVMTPAYLSYHLLLVPSLHAAAIALFASIPKHGYEGTDVKMTYILMCLTAALDILAAFIRGLLNFIMTYCAKVPAMCEMIPEYNLTASVLRRMQPYTGCLLKCLTCIGFSEEYFDRPTRSRKLYNSFLSFFLLDLLTSRGGGKGLDLASYRSFSEDNWALSADLREQCSPAVRRTLRLESFDKSVLLWHIATDLCWKQRAPPRDLDEDQLALRRCTLAISNYMGHLLNFRAEMLLTGSRRRLFTKAMGERETILKASNKKDARLASCSDDDKALAEEITDAANKNAEFYPLINGACVLARELLKVPDDEVRWRLMYRVWLGMLCYSASMCRGYLHAKSLGEGGEFLSVIWLLISLKGAKTLADKLQIPEPEDGDKDLHPATPSPQVGSTDKQLRMPETQEGDDKDIIEAREEGSNLA